MISTTVTTIIIELKSSECDTDGFEERFAVLQFGAEGDAATLEGRDGLLRLFTHAVLIIQRTLKLLRSGK